MPEVSLTRATLRRAEFGFLGVVVYTRVHTPRRWGEPFRAGVLVLPTLSWRPLRTSWLIVGNLFSVRRFVVLSRRPVPVRDSLVVTTPGGRRPPHSGVSMALGRGALPCTSHPRSARTRVRPEPHVDCPAREGERVPVRLGIRSGSSWGPTPARVPERVQTQRPSLPPAW